MEMQREKKGLGCRVYFGIFFVVLGAIAVGVFMFAPEKLPPGIGFKACPAEVTMRESETGEGKIAVVTNPTSKPLHNFTLVTEDAGSDQEKKFVEEEWEPGAEVELGADGEWEWSDEGGIQVSASGYRTKTITY